MDSLRDRNILVSGASSGMGAETAIQLSRIGARVAIVARREEELKKVFGQLEGDGHRYYTQDLGQIEQIEQFVTKLVTEFGMIDGFVNCVGIGEAKPLKFMKYEFNKRMMDINYFSFIEQLRCLAKRGNHNKPFSVVTVSSASAFKGSPADTAYAATKGAMEAAVRCLAKELAHQDIRINTIAPGLINTRLADDFLERGAVGEKMQAVLEHQVLGIGEPIDVAYAAMYLLSARSRLVTGSTIRVDGGYLS